MINFITISPVIELLDAPNTYVTKKEFEQLKNKIKAVIAKKIKNKTQSHSIYIEEKYLFFLEKLNKQFELENKIEKKEVIQKSTGCSEKNSLIITPRHIPWRVIINFMNTINSRKKIMQPVTMTWLFIIVSLVKKEFHIIGITRTNPYFILDVRSMPTMNNIIWKYANRR